MRCSKRLVSKLAAVAATFALGLTAMVAVAPSASAADHGPGIQYGDTWLGLIDFPNGWGLCLDPGWAVGTVPTATHQVDHPHAAFLTWLMFDKAMVDQDWAVAYAMEMKNLSTELGASGGSGTHVPWAALGEPSELVAAYGNYSWAAYQGLSVTTPNFRHQPYVKPVVHGKSQDAVTDYDPTTQIPTSKGIGFKDRWVGNHFPVYSTDTQVATFTLGLVTAVQGWGGGFW